MITFAFLQSEKSPPPPIDIYFSPCYPAPELPSVWWTLAARERLRGWGTAHSFKKIGGVCSAETYRSTNSIVPLRLTVGEPDDESQHENFA